MLAKIKFKILGLFLAILLAGGGLLLYQQYLRSESTLQTQTNRSLELFGDSFHHSLTGLSRQMTLGVEQALENRQIVSAFAQGDRARLSELTLGFFEKRLKPDFGVKQYQFHLPDGSSFFRAHKPEKFGDDLSSFRRTVVAANREQKPQIGMEVGRGGLGLRVVYPVFEGQRHLGSVEFGGSIQQALDRATDQSGAVYAIGVYQRVFEAARRFENQKTDVLDGDLVYYLSANEDLRAILPKILEQAPGHLTIDGHQYATRYFPLKDYSGQEIGRAIAVLNTDALAAQAAEQLWSQATVLGGVLLVGALVLGGFSVMLTRSIARPLNLSFEEMGQGAERIDHASKEVQASSESLSNDASTQAASLEEAASSIEQIDRQAQDNAQSAQSADAGMNEVNRIAETTGELSAQVAQTAEDARERARSGNRSVTELAQAMEKIAQSGSEVAEFVAVINEITQQTKMLATNAAIEAARAGEQGKGFAVVADEVSGLAENSKTAAKEIHRLILDNGKHIEQGNQLAQEAGKALQSILEGVEQVAEVIGEITEANGTQTERIAEMKRQIASISRSSTDQAQGVGQIRELVHGLDRLTQQNSAQAEELSSAASSLRSEADDLNGRIARISAELGLEGRSDQADEEVGAPEPAERPLRLLASMPTRKVV